MRRKRRVGEGREGKRKREEKDGELEVSKRREEEREERSRTRARDEGGRERTYLQRSHALSHIDSKLNHVEDLSVEHPDEDEIMRSLLGVETDEEEGSVVLLSPELERLNGLEGVDVVLLGEVDGLRSLEHSLSR